MTTAKSPSPPKRGRPKKVTPKKIAEPTSSDDEELKDTKHPPSNKKEMCNKSRNKLLQKAYNFINESSDDLNYGCPFCFARYRNNSLNLAGSIIKHCEQ